MNHYLFSDLSTGEEFVVQASSITKAKEIAKENFGMPKFISRMTDFECEMSGLDEY